MNQITQVIPRFDYSILDAAVATEAKKVAEQIRERTRISVIETGRDLIAIREKLPRGAFGPWIADEFQMSERTAYNYMEAAIFLEDKTATVANLPPAIIYALAANTASPEVVKDVVADVDAGKRVTAAMVREKLGAARDAQRKAATAKSIEQLKKDREAEKRRRALQEKRNREHEEQQADIKAAQVKAAEKAAILLVTSLGSGGVIELFTLMRGISFYLLEQQFSHPFRDGQRTFLTVQEIEEKFGHRGVA